MSDIHPKYGVPKEDLCCPGCGKPYRGRVCLNCEECSKCCQCGGKLFIPANEAKRRIAETGSIQEIIGEGN